MRRTGTYDVTLNEDDVRVLRLWRDSLVLMDPRMEDKGLLKVAARSMLDDEYRAQLVSGAEIDGIVRTLDGTELRFVENTPDVLYVVLPPRSSSNESGGIDALIVSRTSGEALFTDDANFGDVFADPAFGTADHGDPTDDH